MPRCSWPSSSTSTSARRNGWDISCSGPRATASITLAASTDNAEGTLAAVIAVAVAVVLLPICHLFIADKVNLSENAMQIATKFGGLLIATIGIQLMLNGIDTFFEIS